MYFVYSVILAAAILVALPYFAVVGLRHGKYWPNLFERLGRVPAALAERSERSPGAIWIHAVSVGEVVAAAPLARRLKDRFPGRRLVVSTTTITGQRLARERIGQADDFLYFPLDWQGPVWRVFRAVRPEIVVILEAEIWPNFLRVARESRVPVVFASARISERSFRRYRWIGGLIRRALADASGFLAQTEEDARRLATLGAPPNRVTVGGNLKFDVAAPEENALARWIRDGCEGARRGPVVVAGSVTAGEESSVLDAFAKVKQKMPGAVLVLAPRKPERFEAAAQLTGQRGWGIARRSQLGLDQPLEAAIGALLLDTIGELGGVYPVSDVVFVGGSLVPAGGHNILEPAAAGRVPVFGSHMQNFREIARTFLESGAGIEVKSGAELGDTWLALLADDTKRASMGRAAQELVERSRGATDRAAQLVAALIAEAAGR